MGLSPTRGSKEAEILSELTPDPGDVVIDKTSASPFNSTATTFANVWTTEQVLAALGASVRQEDLWADTSSSG